MNVLMCLGESSLPLAKPPFQKKLAIVLSMQSSWAWSPAGRRVGADRAEVGRLGETTMRPADRSLTSHLGAARSGQRWRQEPVRSHQWSSEDESVEDVPVTHSSQGNKLLQKGKQITHTHTKLITWC